MLSQIWDFTRKFEESLSRVAEFPFTNSQYKLQKFGDRLNTDS